MSLGERLKFTITPKVEGAIFFSVKIRDKLPRAPSKLQSDDVAGLNLIPWHVSETVLNLNKIFETSLL